MQNIISPRFMLITSMAIFGTLGPFVRNIAVSSGELALYRAILAALLITGFLLITKQKITSTAIKKETPLLLASGMAMGINWILLFEAYKYTTVSLAILSYYFAPVIVMLVCPILFHERLTIKQIICFIMSTLGLILIIGIGDMGGGNNLAWYSVWLGCSSILCNSHSFEQVYQKCRRNPENIFAISCRNHHISSIRPINERHHVRQSGQHRLDQSSDRRYLSYRHHVLHVLLLTERIARPKSRHPQLHRSIGSSPHLNRCLGRSNDLPASNRRYADSRIHTLERDIAKNKPIKQRPLKENHLYSTVFLYL